MHYVKLFNINGIDTKQVGCIELQGVPNAATEGAVGVLGIDITSPTHEVYKCVAVNGSVYTWELLSAGMSIISATITGDGAVSKSFPYSDLLIPNNYVIKVGDLIFDNEGYLYQISSIGSDSCVAAYSGTHLVSAGGNKGYRLSVTDGKLQLITENGNVVSEATVPIYRHTIKIERRDFEACLTVYSGDSRPITDNDDAFLVLTQLHENDRDLCYLWKGIGLYETPTGWATFSINRVRYSIENRGTIDEWRYVTVDTDCPIHNEDGEFYTPGEDIDAAELTITDTVIDIMNEKLIKQ